MRRLRSRIRRTLIPATILTLTAGLATVAAPASAEGIPPPPTTQQCLAATGFACYGVDQIWAAYHMGPLLHQGLDGRGQTIIIFPQFDLPMLAHDMAVFSRAYGLPPADIEVLNPGANGSPDLGNPFDTFGAVDNTAFIEWAHAMAPRAKLLIGEGVNIFDQSGKVQLERLFDAHRVDVVTYHNGDGEKATGRDAVDIGHESIEAAARHHIPVISEAGEIGRLSIINPTEGPDAWWPGDDPLATSVGTTELTLDDAGHRTAPDRVWNDSARLPLPIAGGGGLSQFFARPGYQHAVKQVVGSQRGTPDVAIAGGCDGRLVSYTSYSTFDFYVSQQPFPAGWQPFCGSAMSTSMFAGLIAIAQQAAGRDLGPLNPKLYKAADAFTDVTIGNNAVPATAFLGNVADPGDVATPGYDLVSGLGTPDAARLVADLTQS